jgi:DNA-binding NtrC family response regulator
VRELENFVERACIMRDGPTITVGDLPTPLRGHEGQPVAPSTLVGGMVSLEELEKAHILQVLEAVDWHKKRAAEILDINPSTLYRKLLRYGVGQEGDEVMDDADDNRSDADRVVDAVRSFGEEQAADTEAPAVDAEPVEVD